MATRSGTRHAQHCALHTANDQRAGLEASSRDSRPGGGPDSRRVLALLSHRHGPGFPVLAVSTDIQALTGFPPQAFTQAPRFWVDRIHPDDLPPVLSRLTALDAQSGATLDYRFLTADNDWRRLREEVRLIEAVDDSGATILGSVSGPADNRTTPLPDRSLDNGRPGRLSTDLASLLDWEQIQTMMHDFQKLTGAVFALLDIHGTVLVASGWRDLCTRFHRTHPESARACTQSDLYRSGNVREGEYAAYKCQNGLWDVVTPLCVGGRHLGNIYTGQFFYDDEAVDTEAFACQADRLGYDRQAYLDALAEIPRIPRNRVPVLMAFLVKLTVFIAEQGARNLRLARLVTTSRRMTTALRESERHFRQLVTRAPVPIALFDAAGDTQVLNDRFVSTFGHTRDTLPRLEDWWQMAFPDPQNRQAAREAWRRGMDHGGHTASPALEQEIMGAAGTPRVVETVCSRIGDRTIALFTDITERKRSEAILQASEERLQNLYSLSPVGIFLCTPEGRYLSANQALADLLGYATAEDLVRAVESLPQRTFHDPGEWHDIAETLKTRGKFVNRLVKRHKKDGTPIWVLMNMRAVRAPDGSLSHFEGFTLDITERLLAARALAENEERLRTLINAMPDIVYFKDGQGRWLEANTFTQRLFQLRPDDYLQRTDRELAGLRPNFRGTFIESTISDDLAWHAARMYRGEQAILDSDNTPRMFDLIKVPLFRDDGSRRGIVTVGRDITKQRETSAALAKFNRKLESLVAERTAELEEKAAELEQANARLLELDALKSSFVSSVSHEVRTPLTSILGFTRLIERDFHKHYLPLGQDNRNLAAKGNRIMANLRVIDREGDRLKRLINDFLDLAKIEYGSLRWQDSWVAVAELCAQVADAVQGMFSERPELAFVLDLEPDLPAVWIDPDRLQQVLFNLVGNAVKFTPAGSVTLHVSKESGNSLHLAVSDTGIGIEAQDLERIFEKFHQVQQSPATVDQPRGTGLGLTICRQIVQHYGGTIWAESEPGHGSTFQISLPLGGDAG